MTLLATVKNELHGIFLGFRLEEKHGAYLWRESSGAFHGSMYSSVDAAVRGLRQLYCEPGSKVEFRDEMMRVAA